MTETCECCGDPGDYSTVRRPCGCLLCLCCLEGQGSTCKHGPGCRGQTGGRSLGNLDAEVVWSLRSAGWTASGIAEALGVPVEDVQAALCGRCDSGEQ